ncbi:histidine phosphatase family protein [Siccirubricoccus phaeus]|uniref:histidine phosphatase family protein n=1 Tax=Siccirubricoccus phaeus TaxID=2595053 RepID=UPI0011F2CE80|nr:histidine phosphatase family protein [Siccirubricoccus phaeus]
MATTVLLIRHAAHGVVDQLLCGRMPGIHLGEAGRRQAEALAARLGGAGLRAIHASPLPRAWATALPIASRHGLRPMASEELIEIDFGAWTGRSFAALGDDPHWRRWNAARAAERPPGGETMQEAGQRAFAFLQRAAAEHPDGVIAAVSHGDVIKAVIARVLGVSVDTHARFEISPASLSRIRLWPDGAKLLSMNELPDE